MTVTRSMNPRQEVRKAVPWPPSAEGTSERPHCVGTSGIAQCSGHVVRVAQLEARGSEIKIFRLGPVRASARPPIAFRSPFPS